MLILPISSSLFLAAYRASDIHYPRRVVRVHGPVAFSEEDYKRSPADITSAALPDFSQRDVFLHFHGRGGPDREDADLKQRILDQDRSVGFDRFVHVFVWREWLEAATTERISFTGQAIGRKLGLALAARKELRSLHVCGTSAGGFAANECISAYVAAAGPDRAKTWLTLCDPFCGTMPPLLLLSRAIG